MNLARLHYITGQFREGIVGALHRCVTAVRYASPCLRATTGLSAGGAERAAS